MDTFDSGPARADRVDERYIGRRGVLTFVGELDGESVWMLDAALERAVEHGLAQVWLDLSATTFMDSSGVHCLLRAQRTLARFSRRLAVICPDGPAFRTLAVTDAHRALVVFADKPAAHRAA